MWGLAPLGAPAPPGNVLLDVTQVCPVPLRPASPCPQRVAIKGTPLKVAHYAEADLFAVLTARQASAGACLCSRCLPDAGAACPCCRIRFRSAHNCPHLLAAPARGARYHVRDRLFVVICFLRPAAGSAPGCLLLPLMRAVSRLLP